MLSNPKPFCTTLSYFVSLITSSIDLPIAGPANPIQKLVSGYGVAEPMKFPANSSAFENTPVIGTRFVALAGVLAVLSLSVEGAPSCTSALCFLRKYLDRKFSSQSAQ